MFSFMTMLIALLIFCFFFCFYGELTSCWYLLFITIAAEGEKTESYLSLTNLAFADGERVNGIELYFIIYTLFDSV